MHRFVTLVVVAAAALAAPSFAQEPARAKDGVALQCSLTKDGQVVDRPSLRLESGGSGRISFRDEFTVVITPTRLDAHHVRLALRIDGGDRMINPELEFGDEQRATVSFPKGETTYELKFALVQ
jgi:hypothetical protein